jgi:hypothetical protein
MSATVDTNTDLFDITAMPVTPPRPLPVSMDLDGEEERVCPPAPRRRTRSPSEEADMAAYDAIVRQLVNELTVRLDAPLESRAGGMPPVEGLVSPSGLQRQQAVDSSAAPVCSPRLMVASPAEVFCVGAGALLAPLSLEAGASSPLKRRDSSSDTVGHTGASSPLKRRDSSSDTVGHTGASSPLMRRDTDIEGDLAAAAAANTAEMPSMAEEEEETGSEGESVSADDSENEPSRAAVDAVSDDDGTEADTEGGDTNTVEHVPADGTAEGAGGVSIGLRRQKTGEVALTLEAPVWMWGAAMVAVTAYLWLVALLIKGGGGR